MRTKAQLLGYQVHPSAPSLYCAPPSARRPIDPMNRWPVLAELRSLAVPIIVATRTPIAAAGTAIVARGDNSRWDSHGGPQGTTAGTAMKHGPASVAGTAIGLVPPRDSHQNGATRGQPRRDSGTATGNGTAAGTAINGDTKLVLQPEQEGCASRTPGSAYRKRRASRRSRPPMPTFRFLAWHHVEDSTTDGAAENKRPTTEPSSRLCAVR